MTKVLAVAEFEMAIQPHPRDASSGMVIFAVTTSPSREISVASNGPICTQPGLPPGKGRRDFAGSSSKRILCVAPRLPCLDVRPRSPGPSANRVAYCLAEDRYPLGTDRDYSRFDDPRVATDDVREPPRSDVVMVPTRVVLVPLQTSTPGPPSGPWP